MNKKPVGTAVALDEKLAVAPDQVTESTITFMGRFDPVCPGDDRVTKYSAAVADLLESRSIAGISSSALPVAMPM